MAHAVKASLVALPDRLPAALFRAEDVRALDRTAIEGGVPGYTLMQRAGEAAYRVARLRWPGARELRVYCGTGNNGGDGFVLARLGLADGLSVRLGVQGDPQAIGGDAALARDAWLAAGGRIEPALELDPADADLLVDGLLGTGLQRALGEDWARLVTRLRESGRPVLALDIPTGLNADTGAVMGRVLPARCTVTFIGLKRGLFTGDGPECCGQVVFSDLGVADRVAGARPPSACLLPQGLPGDWPAPRPVTAHKGRFGHLLIVGGDRGMGGAARLAGEAALRAGAGLVSLAVHPDSAGLNAPRPELMVHPVSDPGQLVPLVRRATTLAIGPGLGRGNWGQAMSEQLAGSDLPTVLDADGLFWLARNPALRTNRVITPHPGEAARLLDTDVATIESDRFAALADLLRRYGGCAVLKGAGTLVGDAGGTWVNTSGHAGMASAGSGDVLTGMIGALLAQGLAPRDAALHGVWGHGRCAELAAPSGRPVPAAELAATVSRLF